MMLVMDLDENWYKFANSIHLVSCGCFLPRKDGGTGMCLAI